MLFLSPNTLLVPKQICALLVYLFSDTIGIGGIGIGLHFKIPQACYADEGSLLASCTLTRSKSSSLRFSYDGNVSGLISRAKMPLKMSTRASSHGTSVLWGTSI